MNINLGNNESISIGVFQSGAEFVALTPSTSKEFKTRKGAVKWLSGRGWDENGNRI